MLLQVCAPKSNLPESDHCVFFWWYITAFYCIKSLFISYILQCSKICFDSSTKWESKGEWLKLVSLKCAVVMAVVCMCVCEYVCLFDRVRQIPQLLSIIWNSNCSDADNTFCSPHNYKVGRTQHYVFSTHSMSCVYSTCVLCVMARMDFFFF